MNVTCSDSGLSADGTDSNYASTHSLSPLTWTIKVQFIREIVVGFTLVLIPADLVMGCQCLIKKRELHGLLFSSTDFCQAELI